MVHIFVRIVRRKESMIKIFYGDDRIKAKSEIDRFLGENYEVIEGGELKIGDLPNVFKGTSLFSEKRAILIKDISENQAVWEKVADFVDTEHKIAILETKLDKRKQGYKLLKSAGVEMKEFKLLDPPEKKMVFDIYEMALKDGKKAVEMCKKIENTSNPYMFVGLMVSQALKKYEWRAGTKEKRALKELSKLDMQMKTTSMQPWLLVQAFLLRVSQL